MAFETLGSRYYRQVAIALLNLSFGTVFETLPIGTQLASRRYSC